MATDFSEKHTQNKQNTELPGKTGLTYLALITRSGMEPDFSVKNTKINRILDYQQNRTHLLDTRNQVRYGVSSQCNTHKINRILDYQTKLDSPAWHSSPGQVWGQILVQKTHKINRILNYQQNRTHLLDTRNQVRYGVRSQCNTHKINRILDYQTKQDSPAWHSSPGQHTAFPPWLQMLGTSCNHSMRKSEGQSELATALLNQVVHCLMYSAPSLTDEP